MKWVISKSAICVVFVLFTSVEFASAQTSVSNVNSQTSDSVADSSVGLRTQLETILKSAGKGDQKDFADRIAQLRFPDAANWFSTTFGNRTGKRLVEAYESSYKDYEETLSRIFIESSKRRHTHVFVREFSQSAPEANAQFMQAILADAQVPVRLYTAFVGKDRPTDALPGLYVYADGIFRIVNFATFYGLPNVRPIRVRFGPDFAQEHLVYWVKPVPPAEALKKHGSGEVVLHMIIDRDGNVAQAQVLSGPQELGEAAIDAVHRWRYRPTFLNGDPVEVDATVKILFSPEN